MVAGEPGYYGPKPAVWGTKACISGYWGYYAETGGWGYCGLISVTRGTNENTVHLSRFRTHTHAHALSDQPRWTWKTISLLAGAVLALGVTNSPRRRILIRYAAA